MKVSFKWSWLIGSMKNDHLDSISYLKVSFWWLFYIWLDWLWDATEWGLRSWSTWPRFSRFAMKALWRWAIHFCRYPLLESCANPPFARWGPSTPEQYATSKKIIIDKIIVTNSVFFNYRYKLIIGYLVT